MEGILLVDKPKGWTSFDVVNYVRKIIAMHEGKKPRNVKVGHTGTLDPAATGLLVLVIGKTYTKKVPELIKHDKVYEADVRFNASSTTGDADGEIVHSSEPVVMNGEDVEAVLPQFIGDIEQTPPAYSAVKIDGKRAYELARKGEKPEIKPRNITIHDITMQNFDWPNVSFTMHVGSGTYIRTLAEDIAKQLGTDAYLTDLKRTKVADWSLDDAVTIEGLNAEIIRERLLS